jgi:hypothetical protein
VDTVMLLLHELLFRASQLLCHEVVVVAQEW